VLDPSEIYSLSAGTPRIWRVRDLGAVHIGQAGPLLAESDGVFTMGELVLIEGSGFGKQPTVTIGQRPAELRWRTAGGGIIVRVPPGSAAGPQPLWVEADGRRAETAVNLQRLGLVLDSRRGQLHVVRIGGESGPAPTVQSAGAPLKLPGAHALALSADGAAAYILVRHGEVDDVAIIDLTAPAGPRVHDTRPLRHAAHSLLAAERAPTLAAVGASAVTLWDISEARRPAPWRPTELPDNAQGSQAAALDPAGTLLALALAEGNQVVFVELQAGHTQVRAQPAGQVAVVPLAKQPLLRSLRFASDGQTLWVTAGDNPASRALGHQPTRLVAIEIGAAGTTPDQPAASTERGPRPLTVQKTIELRDAGAPVQLTLGRALPIAAGTTIRTPPEKAAVFLTTVTPTVFEHAAGAESALWRSDGSGNASPLLSGKERLGGLDVSPDARLAVATRCSPGPVGLTVTVTSLAAGTTTSAALGPADEADMQPPFDHLTLSLQP
jgi:hypothetical protein